MSPYGQDRPRKVIVAMKRSGTKPLTEVYPQTKRRSNAQGGRVTHKRQRRALQAINPNNGAASTSGLKKAVKKTYAGPVVRPPTYPISLKHWMKQWRTLLLLAPLARVLMVLAVALLLLLLLCLFVCLLCCPSDPVPVTREEAPPCQPSSEGLSRPGWVR